MQRLNSPVKINNYVIYRAQFVFCTICTVAQTALLHLTLLQDRKCSSLQLKVLEYKERAGCVDKIVSSGSQG